MENIKKIKTNILESIIQILPKGNGLKRDMIKEVLKRKKRKEILENVKSS